MVMIYLSYTTKINKEGEELVLTIDQIWKGLQRKVRFAQEFVPIIESCTVLEEKEDGTVIRDVKFKEGAGPKPQARETVKEYHPSWVDFQQEDGSHIRNVVSNGPSGENSDLFMTYMFEISEPHIEEGSEKKAEATQKWQGMAKMAVEKTIDTIREMVRDGRIES